MRVKVRAAWIFAAAAVLAAGSPARAVDITMTIASGGTPLCTAATSGLTKCDVEGYEGTTVTVTWSLSASQTLNGYDLNVGWDPIELTLLSAEQLFPGSSPPDTIPFLIAPDPGDPLDSQAVTLSLIAYPTTPLFRATFQLSGAPSLGLDCTPDIVWSANGNGLGPGTVVLDNPGGASIDIGVAKACSDGLDNDNDGRIDFDGGVCAGAPPPHVVDPFCTTPTTTREKAPRCGIGAEVALLLSGVAFVRRRTRRARSAS